MCGLAGFLDVTGNALVGTYAQIAGRMADSMIARGPDDAGTWTSEEDGIALGFRRLAIVDLSAEGHQPMFSRSGRYVMVYNGEIYNHTDIRAQLDAAGQGVWRGHSDTEVLLQAIEHFGFEETLQKLNGMFAIALWDTQAKTLCLARDRFGEKPLYYTEMGGAVLFGSELKALKAHPAWRNDVDWNAMSSFLRHSYIPAPYTAFKGVKKLPPGTWLEISSQDHVGAPIPYWSVAERATHAVENPFNGSYEDAVDTLDHLLLDAVGLRVHADVPVGAFLSGGVDSSTVAAAMQKKSSQQIHTYSISFADQKFDEAPFAAAVAAHIGSNHTQMEVSEADCLDVLPSLQNMFDEPFADASQIPTALLAKLTRQHVSVALSGDGGDEMFCGYSRYVRAPEQWSQASCLPAPIRRVLALVHGALKGRPGNGARRARKALSTWIAASPQEHYREYTSWWHSGDNLMPDHSAPETLFDVPGTLAQIEPLSLRFALMDALTYLPDDLLVKVDRTSMAASLEVRAPMLDARIAEFAWSLPEEMKVQNQNGKRVLRDVLYRHVPQKLVDRPKQGFEPPIERWLREGLREWAGDLLAPARLKEQGLLNHKIVNARWQDHASGRRNWAYPLWNVLMMQAWLDAQ